MSSTSRFDSGCARRAWQLVELEQAALAALVQGHEGESVLRDLALGVERVAAPGTLAAVFVVDALAPGAFCLGAAPSLPLVHAAQLASSLSAVGAIPPGNAAWLAAPVIIADIASDDITSNEIASNEIASNEIASDALGKGQRCVALGIGLRACWSVPIVATDGERLGVAMFYYREPRTPVSEDRVLLDGAARLARLVLERERTARAARRSQRRERSLIAAARALATEDDVPRAMQALLAALGDALSPGGVPSPGGVSWAAGAVWLGDGAGSRWRRVAAWSSDPARYARFLADADADAGADACTAAEAGIRQSLAIPIVAGEDVIGRIELFATGDEVVEPELESALRSVGLQVAEFCRRARAQADRQRLIGELRDTLRFSELFASILAHDLRNPLNTLSMGTQLLAKGAAPHDGAILQRMQNSATRMSRMIEQLLDLTRSREGCGLALDRDAVHLGELASAVVHELTIAYPETRIELTSDGDTSGQWDRDRLGQVLSNLVGNAIEHGQGGAVRVRVGAHDAERVSLETHNLGSIDPDAIATLFDPFKPARLTPKRSRGLGLGLYITRLIVAAHGGSIDVCSDAEGTRFRVLLPRTVDAHTPLPAPITLPPASEVRRGQGALAPSASNEA